MPKAAVLVVDDHIVGVSGFDKTRDDDLPDECAEIISVYLLPEYWHKGLGSKLMLWIIHELKTLCFTQCALWTLEENIRAQRAYEKLGFASDGSMKLLEIGGASVRDIRFIKDI